MPANVAHAYFRPGHDITLQADAALTGKTFAKFTGGTGTQPTGTTAEAGDRPAGVVAHDVDAGGFVHLRVGGIVPVTAGDSLTAGGDVYVGADGKAVSTATGGAEGTEGVVIGIAVTNASAGDDAAILLK